MEDAGFIIGLVLTAAAAVLIVVLLVIRIVQFGLGIVKGVNEASEPARGFEVDVKARIPAPGAGTDCGP